MLNLATTTKLLESGKLTEKQFRLISRIHKENLVKANRIKTVRVEVCKQVPNLVRRNPASGAVYRKLQPLKPNKFYQINPDTGERVLARVS
jgi:hypothetical protein